MAKRFLMIMVLGLLLSGNAFAAEPIVIRKDADSITFKHKRLGFIKRNIYAGKHCEQYKKFAHLFYGDKNKSKKEIIYHCSVDYLSISPTSGKGILWSNTGNKNSEAYKAFTKKEKERAKKEEKIAELLTFEGYKTTCQSLGFKPETEKLADCALKLFVEDNKKAPVVQSGTQEIIIRDPDRERRIRLKRYNDWAKSQKWITGN
jgi:hypothetical protein